MNTKSKNPVMSFFVTFWRGRPAWPVLIICIFESLGLLAIPDALMSEESVAIGLWYQIYIVFCALFAIAIIYFLWRMRRLGILIYVSSYVIHNIVAIIVGNWMYGVLLIPAIGILLIVISRKKFIRNGSSGDL